MTTFSSLGIAEPILTALTDYGYEIPTVIQEKAIPAGLAGRDVLGSAQTGTGKTCAFGVPILQRLAQKGAGQRIRALILTPTRELAIQIDDNLHAYGKNLPLTEAVIFGGVGQTPQVEQLKRGVDILTATPGRLLDLSGQGLLDLSGVEIFVLDEADRMLDMGFIHDVRRVIRLLPQKKQTMFFSATLPPEIMDLVDSLLHDPVRAAAAPVSTPVEIIRQEVCLVDRGNKTSLLLAILDQEQVGNALVFTRTKHGADKVARDLNRKGVAAAAIHGNKSQTARQESLRKFKAGEVRVLVATDIAARGLDIEDLAFVFNYNLPEVPETYIHRIGRTGRAGKGGTAISFCDYGEMPLLRDIEKLLKKPIPRRDHNYPMEVFEAPKKDAKGRVVNPEDAEARQAAREKNAARKKQQQAAPPPPPPPPACGPRRGGGPPQHRQAQAPPGQGAGRPTTPGRRPGPGAPAGGEAPADLPPRQAEPGEPGGLPGRPAHGGGVGDLPPPGPPGGGRDHGRHRPPPGGQARLPLLQTQQQRRLPQKEGQGGREKGQGRPGGESPPGRPSRPAAEGPQEGGTRPGPEGQRLPPSSPPAGPGTGTHPPSGGASQEPAEGLHRAAEPHEALLYRTRLRVPERSHDPSI